MVGQGGRQSTPYWIELLPEALVVIAQVAQESWSLLLPMLAAFPANGGGETPRQYSDTLRIMPHCISELRSHAPTFLIKIRLVTPHAPRGPATTDMLAAGGSCCMNQDLAQLCMSRVRQPAPIPRGLSSWLLPASSAYSSYFKFQSRRPSAGSLLLSETLDLVRAGCRQA